MRSTNKQEAPENLFQEEILTSFKRFGLIPQTQSFSLENFSSISYTYVGQHARAPLAAHVDPHVELNNVRVDGYTRAFAYTGADMHLYMRV